MYEFIQNNRKKLLAIFTGFLMIVFILPSTCQNRYSDSRVLVGHFGDEEVYLPAINRSKDYLRAAENLLVNVARSPSAPAQYVSVYEALPAFSNQNPGDPESLRYRVLNRPDYFYALLREADMMGVRISDQEVVDSLVSSGFMYRMEGRGLVPLADLQRIDKRLFAFVIESVRALFSVEAALERAFSMVRISEPLRNYHLARKAQQLKLHVVELDARSFEAKVPAPTPEQLSEHFKKYAAFSSGVSESNSNPFGFGYKLEQRIQLQYISIPKDLLRASIRQGRSEYDWTVEAQKFLLRNPGKYQATQPSGIDPLSLSPTATPATTRPATRPFEEVREQIILEELIEPQIRSVARAIKSEVLEQMNLDFTNYAKSPGNPPNTRFGMPYNSYEYLGAIAAEVQKNHNVLPRTEAIANVDLTRRDLSNQPMIGGAFYRTDVSFTPIDRYLFDRFVDFRTALERERSDTLQLFQPSPIFEDDAGNLFIARITSAKGAEVPTDPASAGDGLERDFRKAAAFGLARDAAAKLLERATESSLPSAAAAEGLTSVTTGYIMQQSIGRMSFVPPIENLKLNTASNNIVYEAAINLLSNSTAEKPGKSIVELPLESKVLVIELASIKPIWSEETMHVAARRAELEQAGSLVSEFAIEWFDLKNVFKRTKWRELGQTPSTEPTEK